MGEKPFKFYYDGNFPKASAIILNQTPLMWKVKQSLPRETLAVLTASPDLAVFSEDQEGFRENIIV